MKKLFAFISIVLFVFIIIQTEVMAQEEHILALINPGQNYLIIVINQPT